MPGATPLVQAMEACCRKVRVRDVGALRRHDLTCGGAATDCCRGPCVVAR